MASFRRPVDGGAVPGAVGHTEAGWPCLGHDPGRLGGHHPAHLEAALGNRRLARRPVADVNGLWAAKRKAGYKPISVRILRAVLRRALAQAERKQLVPHNVAALSQPAKLGQPDGRALTVDQAKKLLDTARGDRLEAAFLVILSYGLRRGELLGLMWADLDWDRQTLHVRQAVRRRKSAKGDDGTYLGGGFGRIEIVNLKTRRSRRVLFLTDAIITALDRHERRQRKEVREAGDLWVDHGLIFTSLVGTPVDPDNFAKAFVRLCKAAGLGHWRPHEARHSAASVMLAPGCAA